MSINVRRQVAGIAIVLALVATASTVHAQSLLVRSGGHASSFGGAKWSAQSTAINSAFESITVWNSFAGTGDLSGFDALWVDLNPYQALSADESELIREFVDSGRRVVLFGESDRWLVNSVFSSTLSSALGGTYLGGQYSGVFETALTHSLTAGVHSVSFSVGGTASGGASLFTQAIASLWGPGANALLMLDVNAFDDDQRVLADNARFGENVVGWLAGEELPGTTTPEPISMALLGTGLAGTALLRRRRRNTQDGTAA